MFDVKMNRPVRIISGGQTGVDRGALDFALWNGVECGGWCPPGRKSESGRIPERYPLREVEIPDYDERTRRNILDSDATLVITAGGKMEKGTRLTLKWAGEYGRPLYHLDLESMDIPGEAVMEGLADWLGSTVTSTLNVAGNRESTSPGIGGLTVKILERLFGTRAVR